VGNLALETSELRKRKEKENKERHRRGLVVVFTGVFG